MTAWGRRWSSAWSGSMLPGVATDSNYQLQIEDAVAVSESDTVIFVDAAVER